MKHLFSFFVVATLLLIVGCSKEYDDSALVGRVDDLENRVQRLEQLCQQMNTNISSLQTIVTALQNNDYVTGVTPITENGKTIGYTITFAKAQSITIYHGKDGQDGADGKDGKDGQDGADGKDGQDGADGKDGKDGYTPQIGVKQDADGIYYWTLDGEWLLDADGNKIKAQGTDGKDGADGEDGKDGVNGTDGKDGEDGEDGQDGVNGTDGKNGEDGKDGITPQLKIENDYWYVSYDNGASWTQLGKATGEDGKDGQNGANGTNGIDGVDGDSFFLGVAQDESNVYFTLADGTVITLPKSLALSIEFAESDLVVMSPNSTREIAYTVTSATDSVKVEVISSADIKAKVVADDANGLAGKIHITTGATIDEYSKVIVFVSNGHKVIMRSITFEEAGLVVEENAIKQASAEGGEVVLEFLSNVDCKVVIPEDAQSWISVVPTTRAMEKQTITLKLEPNEDATRSAEVDVKSVDGKLSFTYTISQEADMDYQLALEREALIAIYNALDGDNWTNNENWCSDKPVSEWYGVFTNEDGNVRSLTLSGVKTGNIPSEICYLEDLEGLYLASHHLSGESFLVDMLRKLKQLNKFESLIIEGHSWYGTGGFTGMIPDELWELTNLEVLRLEHNNFKGGLSGKISNLKNLSYLSLLDSQLQGNLPSELGNLTQLTGINLQFNQFTGEIPEKFFETDAWKNNWAGVIAEYNGFADIYFGRNNKFTLDNLVIPAKSWDNMYDINGNVVNLPNVYESNQYTILYQYAPNDGYWDQMCDIYKYYNSKIEIVGWGSYWEPCSYSGIEEFVKTNNIEWISINGDYNYPTSSGVFDGVYRSYITVVDNKGYVVFSDYLTSRAKLIQFLNENLGGNMANDTYFSSDYSQDGVVNILQTALKGEGIDIVLMGDAYSDRQIADGTYKTDMEYLYNNLFTEEPYKSFKDHFNVYYVNVVSDIEGYDYSFLGATALGGYFGGGTLVGGNHNAVFSYALKAISEEEMDEAMLIVAMNSDNYAGTCYMYYPTDTTGTYGSGPSVSYFSRGGDATTFAQHLHHEACGHGFAKLADEYAYEGTIPEDEVLEYLNQQNDWGWWKNVDFTNDQNVIRWSHFINDSRYTNERVGAYEGGLTYQSGVWRPTENSIMHSNTGGFNAPCREAIYYRIHKLAYGDSWEYDYEEFVEWDARNRTPEAMAARAKSHKPSNYKPTHPPVIVNKSWRNAN